MGINRDKYVLVQLHTGKKWFEKFPRAPRPKMKKRFWDNNNTKGKVCINKKAHLAAPKKLQQHK